MEDLVQILKDIKCLPKDKQERATNVLNLNQGSKRELNCVSVALYVWGYSKSLFLESLEMINLSLDISRLSRTQSVIVPAAGDLAVFGGSELEDEHYGIYLQDNKIFSMLGVGGEILVSSIDEIYHIFNETRVNRVKYIR